MPEPPDGPYYRCADGRSCDTYERLCEGLGCVHPPDKLRYIKGIWQCFECFYDNYADGTPDPQYAWDDAPTVGGM